MYLGMNWYSHHYQIQNFFYWQWELNIPLIEWFILVYFSAYLSFLPVFFGLDFNGHLNIAKALIVSGIIGCFIFFIYPTSCAYTRDLNEIQHFKYFFQFLWGQDNPVTLMPSFHVAMSGIFLLPIIKATKLGKIKFLYLIWLALICLSIVLVHQHHVVDIFSGLALSYLSLKLMAKVKTNG